MVKTTSYSALTAAHFVFELERASIFMQDRGDIRGPSAVALHPGYELTYPNFERPIDGHEVEERH